MRIGPLMRGHYYNVELRRGVFVQRLLYGAGRKYPALPPCTIKNGLIRQLMEPLKKSPKKIGFEMEKDANSSYAIS